MANLPEKIQVEYIKTINGVNEKGTCKLSELLSDSMKDVRQNIISLALLPLYNKNNTLFEDEKKNPSLYIKDFPMLQYLAYPSQWVTLSPRTMQNSNCPNLRIILRTVPEGYKGEVSEISVKGTPNIVLKEDGSEDIQTYGEVIGTGTDLYSIIHINPKTPVKSKSSKSKGQQYVTYDILIQKIEEININLIAMERRISQGNSAQITKTKIINILNNFVGRITQEQLDAIITEIRKGIDVNIPVDTIIENIDNLESLVSKGFANLSNQEKNHYQKLLEEIQAIAESENGRDEKLIAIKELILSKSAEYFRTNNSLLQQILIKQGLIESEITKEGGINDKLDLLGIGMEDLVNLLINEFKSMHDSVSNLATTDEVREIMTTALGQFVIEIKEDIARGNREYLEAIGKTLSTIPTIDSIRQIVEEGFKKTAIANGELLRYATEEIIDRIINSFGDIAHLDETDLEKISSVVMNIIESDQFKSIISNILND